jgi:uncharacterized 2Fe-2S/4Fe-4S cluster protein (DUF4445 family)
MAQRRVTIHPENLTIDVTFGTSFADVLKKADIPINLPCGGEGRCGKCIVKVLSAAPPPTPEEKNFLSKEHLDDGLRLACRLTIQDDIVVEVPRSTRVSGVGKTWEDVHLFTDGGEIPDALLLSVDLGTTNIAAAVIDPEKGNILAQTSAKNPQASYGADVISRITAVSKNPVALNEQQRLVVDEVNRLSEKLTGHLGTTPGAIAGAAVCGNPTMEHLFLGIDPVPIAFSPFTPRFTTAQEVRASDIGLVEVPDGEVYVFPVISGYVGGDTLAFIWSSRIFQSEGIILGIDIGTNGEIVLGNKEAIAACSAAAGPAFEGSHIRDGMRADIGAIEGVSITGGRIELSVKGGGTPKGICGSGLIDAASQLLRAHVIDPTGRIQKDGESFPDRVQKKNGITEFVLYQNESLSIGITQKDIREIQLAKGAIRSGVEILMEERGVSWDDITMVLIAGSFGNYLKGESIADVGLVSESVRDRIHFVGDAALMGAVEAVSSEKTRKEIEILATKINYIELSSDKRFNEHFVRWLSF